MASLSIIVPVYNKGKNLRSSIGSLLKQTFQDFEILLINDGSQDNSGIICEELSRFDKRIKTTHTKNEGVSNARNIGIDLAKSNYITFFDCDDWIPKNGYKKLMNIINESNTDMSMGGIELIYPHANINLPTIEGVFNKDNIATKHNDIYSIEQSSCAKIFKTDIIKSNGLCFPIGMANGEDCVFLCNYFNCVESFASTKEVVYQYNKLLKTSGSTRYNKNINEWRYQQFEAQAEFYLNWFSEATNIDEMICCRAIKRCCESIREYSENNGLTDKDKQVKYYETYKLFNKYIKKYNNENSLLKDNIDREIATYLYKKDFEELTRFLNGSVNNDVSLIRKLIKPIYEILRIVKLNYYYGKYQ